MFFGKNKKTKVDLTGSAMSAVRHVQQAVEVLTGEYVLLDHMPIVLGPVQRRERGGYCPILERNVEIECKGQLFPSQRRFTFVMSETITKKDKSCTFERWEIWGTIDFALTFENEAQKWYSAKWKHSNVLFPEVWVINKFGPTVPSKEKAMWKVGRDRTERREEPLSMFD